MLIGYNNDVEHRGKTFHIQTEDRGQTDDTIETQLFHGGAILDTKITDYTELVQGLEGKERDKKVKSLMKASHRSLFKKLMAGEYDEMVGLEAPSGGEVKEVEFQPGQDRVPAAAMAIEEGELEDVADLGEEHVGLSSLKDKLATLKEKSSSQAEEISATLEEESEDPATAIMDSPPEMVAAFESKEFEQPLARKSEGLKAAKAASESVEFAATGVKAWSGCEEPEEDLSLTTLVGDFLAS